jgi:hypothetical protein
VRISEDNVAQRRRELACIEFEIAMEEEDGGRKFCVEDINEKLEKEGLPPFASDDEMMQVVNKQWDLEANAMRAILRFLKETGARRLVDFQTNEGGSDVVRNWRLFFLSIPLRLFRVPAMIDNQNATTWWRRFLRLFSAARPS